MFQNSKKIRSSRPIIFGDTSGVGGGKGGGLRFHRHRSATESSCYLCLCSDFVFCWNKSIDKVNMLLQELSR